MQVHLLPDDVEHVAVAVSIDAGRAVVGRYAGKGPPQPGNVRVQGAAGCLWRRRPPDPFGERVDRHRVTGIHGQGRQNGSALPRSHVNQTPGGFCLNRTQQSNP
jgi:hypothetical protein